jgi:O-antigen ligase
LFENLQGILTNLAALFCGFAAGGAWIGVVVVPNASFDHMDYTRADRHVREVLKTGSTVIAGALLLAAALSVLGGAIGAGAVATLAAFGFFTNRWTLAKRAAPSAPPGTRQRKKSQRIVAVALSLIFGLASATAGIMASFGV